MRVLLVAPDYPPKTGGIARLLGDLVRNSSQNVEWRVLTGVPGLCDETTVRYRSVAECMTEVSRAAAWLRSASTRLVVCGHVYASGEALLAARLARAPLSSIVYGMELVAKRYRHSLTLQMLRTSHRVVAISRHSASVATRVGVKPDRIRIVNPCLSTPWPNSPAPRPRDLGRDLRLVYIGRMTEGYKNVELVLRLVSVLAHGTSPVEATVIGGGPRLSALQRKAQHLGVERRIEFLGALSDARMADVLEEAHLGLFPSRDSPAAGGFEGFGLVIHEMAATALPVLVGKAAGAIDACGVGWSLLLDPDDLRAWVNAVDAVGRDEPKRLSMARSAVEWTRGRDSVAVAYRFLEALGDFPRPVSMLARRREKSYADLGRGPERRPPC